MNDEEPLPGDEETPEEDDGKKDEIDLRLLMELNTRLARQIASDPKGAWGIFVKYVFTWKWGFVLILLGLLTWGAISITHYCDKNDLKEVVHTNEINIAEITKTNLAAIAGLSEKVVTLKEENSQMRQERDKYQMLLAPFQALALTTYTNGTVEQKLEKLGETILDVQNTIAFEKPNLLVEVNGEKLTPLTVHFEGQMTNYIGSPINAAVILIPKSREVSFKVTNVSGAPAERLTILLSAQIEATNMISVGWNYMSFNKDIHQWSIVADNSVAEKVPFFANTLQISTNFSGAAFFGNITVYANRAKTVAYPAVFLLE